MLWPRAQDRVLRYVLKYVKKFRVIPRAQIEHGFAISYLSTTRREFSSYRAQVILLLSYLTVDKTISAALK